MESREITEQIYYWLIKNGINCERISKPFYLKFKDDPEKYEIFKSNMSSYIYRNFYDFLLTIKSNLKTKDSVVYVHTKCEFQIAKNGIPEIILNISII